MTRKPRAALAALGLVAALGLAGCGELGGAGTAAEVGGEVITVQYLQEQVGEIVKMAGRTTGDITDSELSNTQRAVLVNLVEQRLIVEAAANADIEVTDAEVSRFVAQVRDQRGQVPPDMLEGYARWGLLSQKLATKLLGRQPGSQEDQAEAQELVSAELAKVAKRVGVKVNPRYGSWNGTTITPEGGELVKVTPEEGLAPEAPAGS